MNDTQPQISDLESLKKIIYTNTNYQLQIISLEPFEQIIDLLELQNTKILFTSQLCASSLETTQTCFIIDDDTQKLIKSKYIPPKSLIFCKNPNTFFTKHIFSLSVSEKKIIANMVYNKQVYKKVVPYLRDYNLGQIQRFAENKSVRVVPVLNEIEATVVYALIKNKKFCDVYRCVKRMGVNAFRLMVTLNSLVENGIASKKKGSYRLRISRESVKSICLEIGMDIEMI